MKPLPEWKKKAWEKFLKYSKYEDHHSKKNSSYVKKKDREGLKLKAGPKTYKVSRKIDSISL